MTVERIARVVAIAALLLAPARATTQEVRGTVVDVASGFAIAGAVVQIEGADGQSVHRVLTDGTGAFRIIASPEAIRLRVLRIGFRPYTISLSEVTGPLRVAMTRVPTMLEPVRVADGRRCPARRDRPRALGLWEHARNAILASVVAQETRPAELTVLGFERRMDGNPERITHQNVRIDTVRAVTPFAAARNATDFVLAGFTTRAPQGIWYHGPDARVLLSQSFALEYCFHLDEPSAARPGQVGLAFRPRAPKEGRIDIAGTLWVDTLKRELRDIEFRYAGLDRSTNDYRPGGFISFREIAGRLTVIDRWHLRLLATRADTGRGSDLRDWINTWYEVTEAGGELARANWSDGISWRASLGTLRGRTVSRNGELVPGQLVRLDSTSYEAVSGPDGVFTIEDLLPGPYGAHLVRPELIQVGLTVPTGFRFSADRGKVTMAHVVVPTMWEYVGDDCRRGESKDRKFEGDARLLVRFLRPGMEPAGRTPWRLGTIEELKVTPVAQGETSDDGVMSWCSLTRGTQVELRLDAKEKMATIIELRDSVTIVPFYLPRR